MIQGRDTAHMLRAVFHDSVGKPFIIPTVGQVTQYVVMCLLLNLCIGGSDGCLNRNVDANKGFDNDEDNFIRIVDTLDDFYDNEADCSGLSRLQTHEACQLHVLYKAIV